MKTESKKSHGSKAETTQGINMGKKKLDKVTLIFVPLHLGGPHRGVSMGPAAMKVAEVAEKIERLGFSVRNEVEVSVPNSICWAEHGSAPKCVPEITEVSLQVAEAVEEAMSNDSIPVTIGGDHSLAIGSIAGVSNYYRKRQENFGLVWFDAHGDINTPDTTSSGNVHGMPLAVSLGYGDKRMVDLLGFSPKVQPNRSVLIGIRDLDPPEREMIDQSGITPYTIRDIDHLGLSRVTDLAVSSLGSDIAGLHLSFDIDVIDPDVAPGVSTAAPGGLNYRESLHALTLLAESRLLRSIDIVELNPANDIRNKTAELATDLILASLGRRIL